MSHPLEHLTGNLIYLQLIFSLLMKCVASDFCAICNCCPPNTQFFSAGKLPEKVRSSADESAGFNPLLGQNDAPAPAAPFPIPKPVALVGNRASNFYKIEPESNKGIQPKISLTTLLQRPLDGFASQAILLPMPVATLILHHHHHPGCSSKCDCSEPSSSASSSTTTPKSATEECEKCAEEVKNVEADEEMLTATTTTASEHSKEVEDCREANREDELQERSETEESPTTPCSICADCPKAEKECCQNVATEVSPYEDQKVKRIPIEIFKNFVAKGAGFAPKTVAKVDESQQQQHDDSFESLKDRLKDISNKVDLLKNLSMEMKTSQQMFPLAKLTTNDDGFREPQILDYGRQNMRRSRVGMGPVDERRHYPNGISDNIRQTMEQQQQQNAKQTDQMAQQNQFSRNRLLFEPTYLRNDQTTTQKPEAFRELQMNFFTPILQTSTQKVTIGNQQQFLLTAIEEFLRESQKHRQKPIQMSRTTVKLATSTESTTPTLRTIIDTKPIANNIPEELKSNADEQKIQEPMPAAIDVPTMPMPTTLFIHTIALTTASPPAQLMSTMMTTITLPPQVIPSFGINAAISIPTTTTKAFTVVAPFKNVESMLPDNKTTTTAETMVDATIISKNNTSPPTPEPYQGTDVESEGNSTVIESTTQKQSEAESTMGIASSVSVDSVVDATGVGANLTFASPVQNDQTLGDPAANAHREPAEPQLSEGIGENLEAEDGGLIPPMGAHVDTRARARLINLISTLDDRPGYKESDERGSSKKRRHGGT